MKCFQEATASWQDISACLGSLLQVPGGVGRAPGQPRRGGQGAVEDYPGEESGTPDYRGRDVRHIPGIR